jgi:hypothetical protein
VRGELPGGGGMFLVLLWIGFPMMMSGTHQGQHVATLVLPGTEQRDALPLWISPFVMEVRGARVLQQGIHLISRHAPVDSSKQTLTEVNQTIGNMPDFETLACGTGDTVN